jgi:hypothetical protein
VNCYVCEGVHEALRHEAEASDEDDFEAESEADDQIELETLALEIEALERQLEPLVLSDHLIVPPTVKSSRSRVYDDDVADDIAAFSAHNTRHAPRFNENWMRSMRLGSRKGKTKLRSTVSFESVCTRYPGMLLSMTAPRLTVQWSQFEVCSQTLDLVDHALARLTTDQIMLQVERPKHPSTRMFATRRRTAALEAETYEGMFDILYPQGLQGTIHANQRIVSYLKDGYNRLSRADRPLESRGYGRESREEWQ